MVALAQFREGARPNNKSGTVSVIDTSTNTVIDTIPTPDDARVYVSNGSSTVTINEFDVIDTATDKLTAVIPNPDNCSFGIAMAPLIPQTKDDCTNGGYQRFRSLAFRNQGQCIKYVEHGK